MPTTPHQLPLYVIYPSKKSRAGLVVCSLSCATRWATATGKPFMIRSTPPGGSCAYCVGCGMRQHLPDRCLFHGANPCQPTDWTQSIAAAPIIRGIYLRTRQPVTAAQVSEAYDVRALHPGLTASEVAQAVVARTAPPTGIR